MDDIFGKNADEEFFAHLERRGKLNFQKIFNENTDLENAAAVLTYEPVESKQQTTSKSITTTQSSGTKTLNWTTVVAKVVNAYNGSQSVGRVGFALLKGTNTDQCAYKLIIYRTKSDVLCTSTIRQIQDTQSDQQQKVLIHKNAYFQFYDDDYNYWSVHFDNKTDELDVFDKLASHDIVVERSVAESQQTPQPEMNKDETKTVKTNLLTRISKVGQALPNLTKQDSNASETGTSTTNSSHTTLNDSIEKLDVIVTPAAMPRKLMAPYEEPVAKPVIPAPRHDLTYKNMEQQMMQMLLTEMRTENSEARLNLNKVDFKLDKIMDKLDKLTANGGFDSANQQLTLQQQQKKQANKYEDEILTLEEKLLELKRENHVLRQQLLTKNTNLQSDNETPINNLDTLEKNRLEVQKKLSMPNSCENCKTLLNDLTTKRDGYDNLCKQMDTVNQENAELKDKLQKTRERLKIAIFTIKTNKMRDYTEEAEKYLKSNKHE